MAEKILPPIRLCGWRPREVASALGVPCETISDGPPRVGDLLCVARSRDEIGNHLVVYESFRYVYDPADGARKTLGEFVMWDIIRTSLFGTFLNSPILDLRAKDIQIDTITIGAINHHLSNALMTIHDDDSEVRDRSLRRLQDLCTALRESHQRWKDARDDS
jgi:hypothetical protein